jgi:hypothetical protein
VHLLADAHRSLLTFYVSSPASEVRMELPHGITHGDPRNKMDLKTFHCQIQSNHKAIKPKELCYQNKPSILNINSKEILLNYHRIKEDIKALK